MLIRTVHTVGINPGTIPNVFVEGLLAELDEAEEYFVDDEKGQLYVVHNGTGAPATANASRQRQRRLQNGQCVPVRIQNLWGVNNMSFCQ